MTQQLDCHGTPPLTARTEPWMDALTQDAQLCAALVEQHGSPLNVHNFEPMRRNIDELRDAAAQHQIAFQVFFARKANKTHGAALAAHRAGAGIDVASQRELEQCLNLGIPGHAIIFSAATKTPAAIDAALAGGVTISVDNADELALISARATGGSVPAQIALRLSVLDPEIPPTRFGLAAGQWLEALGSCAVESLSITGIHFHLNGYSAEHRAIGLRQALTFADQLRSLGHPVEFIDMGGGIPMSYLDSKAQWQEFWRAVAASADAGALDAAGVGTGGLGEDVVAVGRSGANGDTTNPARPGGLGAGVTGSGITGSGPTWRGDTLGLVDHEADRPSPATYPYYQAVTRGEWLRQILSAPAGSDGGTVADELRSQKIELRCEPGRSLLDGCGMTIAQVAFRKHTSDGVPLVGLYMNRTQVRSTSADFLVDPVLIRRSPQPVASGSSSDLGHLASSDPSAPSDPLSGAFLVGSYCIEEELILRRSIDFPNGVQVGDLIAFPNTGGYLMHILESASHQLPLAANLVATPGDSKLGIPEHWVLDGVDR